MHLTINVNVNNYYFNNYYFADILSAVDFQIGWGTDTTLPPSFKNCPNSSAFDKIR